MLLIGGSLFAQNAQLDQFFQNHVDDPAFMTHYVDAEEIEQHLVVGSAETDALRPMLDDFESMAFLMFEGDDATRAAGFFNEVNSIVSRDAGLEDVISVRSDEMSMRASIRQTQENRLEEFVAVFQDDEDFILVLLRGDLELSNVKQYGEMFHLVPELFGDQMQSAERSEIPQIDVLSVDVSPNPSASQFQIAYMLNETQNLSWQIQDLSGRVLASEDSRLMHPGNYRISWEAPEAGVYQLIFQSESGKQTQQLMSVR
jgi:hypothetical protein